jgi:hypothetical protein
MNELYESIASTTVGAGGTATVTFSAIPSTYKSLQIRMFVRTSRTNALDYLIVRFNSDSGNNYWTHELIADASTVYSTNSSSATNSLSFLRTGSDNVGANIFSNGVADIVDYADTNKYKSVKNMQVCDIGGGAGRIYFSSGIWNNTSAITSISLTAGVGPLIKEYSSIALYGIK